MKVVGISGGGAVAGGDNSESDVGRRMIMQWNVADVSGGEVLARRLRGHAAFEDEETGDIFLVGGIQLQADPYVFELWCALYVYIKHLIPFQTL